MARTAVSHPPRRRHGANCLRAADASHRRPAVGPWITHSTAPSGSLRRISGHGSSCSHAQRSIPASRRLPPFPRRTTTAPRDLSRSLSWSARASLIRTPARQSRTISGAESVAVGAVADCAHDGDDLFNRRWVSRVLLAFVAWVDGLGGSRAWSRVSGGGRRRPAAWIPCILPWWDGLVVLLFEPGRWHRSEALAATQRAPWCPRKRGTGPPVGQMPRGVMRAGLAVGRPD